MVPLSLPEQDRRVILRSFWGVITAIAAILGGLLGRMLGVPFWLAGLVVFVAMGSLAFSHQHLIQRLYHAWNNRIIKPLSNIAAAIILRSCLLLIFAATGRAGSRIQIRGADGSLWNSRDLEKNRTTSLTFAGAGQPGGPGRGWIRNYLRWALHSDNAWAIALIPFLFLLRMVSTEEPTSSGAYIYTLF